MRAMEQRFLIIMVARQLCCGLMYGNERLFRIYKSYTNRSSHLATYIRTATCSRSDVCGTARDAVDDDDDDDGDGSRTRIHIWLLSNAILCNNIAAAAVSHPFIICRTSAPRWVGSFQWIYLHHRASQYANIYLTLYRDVRRTTQLKHSPCWTPKNGCSDFMAFCFR